MREMHVLIKEAEDAIKSLKAEDREPLLRNIEGRIIDGGPEELIFIAQPPLMDAEKKYKPSIIKKFILIYRALLEDKHSIENIMTVDEAAEEWGLDKAVIITAIEDGKFHNSEFRLSGDVYLIRRTAMNREFHLFVNSEDLNNIDGMSQRLIELRKEFGYGIDYIANFIGVTTRQYIEWEIYAGDAPTTRIKLLGDLYEVSPVYIMGMTDERNLNGQ